MSGYYNTLARFLRAIAVAWIGGSEDTPYLIQVDVADRQ